MTTHGKLTPSQQRERKIISVLLKVGIGLGVFGLIATFLLTVIIPRFRSTLPTTSASYNPQATYNYPSIDYSSAMQPLSSVDQGLLRVVIITPKNMQTGQTFPVTVLLFADTTADLQVYQAFTEQNNLINPQYAYSFYSLLSQPVDPSADNSLGDYFGTNYPEVAATANLIAPYSTSSGLSLNDTSSAALPGQPDERSLDTYGIMWEWDVTPQEVGQQILSLNITATWSPQVSSSASLSTATPAPTAAPTDTKTRQLLLTSIPVRVNATLVYPSLQDLFTGISTGLTTTGAALVSTTFLALILHMLYNWIFLKIPPWEQKVDPSSENDSHQVSAQHNS